MIPAARGRRVTECASLALLVAVAEGCTSTPAEQRYQAPSADAPTAQIINAGAFGLLATIDGKETPAFAHQTAVAPGAHRVALNCLYRAGQVEEFATKMEHAVLTGIFAAGQKYYVRCSVEEGRPHAFLAASPNGAPLPGFE